jgi:hypothetical protein
MKQMVAGPCLTLQEVNESKKRMFQQLTGRKEESEILVSKYFKKPESPGEMVNLRAVKNSFTSESWHVKRDDEKYAHNLLQETKAPQVLA